QRRDRAHAVVADDKECLAGGEGWILALPLSRGVPYERSPYGLPGALLEPPPSRIVLRAEHPVAAMVRGRCRSHQHSIFPVPAQHPLAADPVGRGVHEHQPVPDLAHLHGTRAGGAVTRRADTLRDGVHSLTPRDFVALVMVGAWKEGTIGDKILSEGQPVSSVCVAIRGAIRIHGRGRDLGLLEPG